MSGHSQLSNESVAGTGDSEHRERPLSHRLGRSLKPAAQFCSFWAAIALPFVHMPLLARGLDDASITAAFFLLFATNVLAFYVARDYNR